MKNRILRSLPEKEYQIIEPHLSSVILQPNTVLNRSDSTGRVYLPNEALISFLSDTVEGETIEVAMVGNEGVIGIESLSAAATPFRVSVQIQGGSYQMSAQSLTSELRRCEVLPQLLQRYQNALLVQVAQTAVCNRFHSIEQRFCRWLLMANDRAEIADLAITHDAMARILGARRASVTVASGALQEAGLIKSRRGMITIVNQHRLKTAACECYHTIAAAYSTIPGRR